MPAPRVLVTAFGPFPGAPVNPTPAIAAELAERLAGRTDLRVSVRVLPTVWSLLDDLPSLLAEVDPAIALHLGLAGRARTVRLEARGLNRITPTRRDAAGCLAPGDRLGALGPPVRRSGLPLPAMADAMRRAGLAVSLSRDAGDYLCNALFYASLGLAPPARQVGFVHVPRTRDMPGAPADAPTIAAIADGLRRAIDVLVEPTRARAPAAEGVAVPV